MTQSSTFIKHWTFSLSRTWNTKRWPPNYDVMIWWRSPRHAPHIWGRRQRCVFDLPYACMHWCVNTRVVPSSAAQTWYGGEKSDGHTMFSFVLNPKFHWSIEDGRAQTVALTSKCTKCCRRRRPTISHIVESRHRLGLSLIGAYQNCFVQVSLACQ